MKLNKVIIGAGSNIDPNQNIKEAQNALANYLNLIKTSALIETEPIGCSNQNNFLNCAFLVETEMGSATLKSWLKDLENRMGRIRTENKNGPRTIDLDIVVWNGEVVDSEVYEREFLRNSINELLPELKIEK